MNHLLQRTDVTIIKRPRGSVKAPRFWGMVAQQWRQYVRMGAWEVRRAQRVSMPPRTETERPPYAWRMLEKRTSHGREAWAGGAVNDSCDCRPFLPDKRNPRVYR